MTAPQRIRYVYEGPAIPLSGGRWAVETSGITSLMLPTHTSTDNPTPLPGSVVEIIDPEYVDGDYYLDADNDLFIHDNGQWCTPSGGIRYSDQYPTRPLVHLVKAES